MIGSLQTFEKPQAVAHSDKFSQIAGEGVVKSVWQREVNVRCFESSGTGISLYHWLDVSILSHIAISGP